MVKKLKMRSKTKHLDSEQIHLLCHGNPLEKKPSVTLPHHLSEEKKFFEYVYVGGAEKVHMFLEEHTSFNINLRNYQGLTALTVAVKNEFKELVELLLHFEELDIGDNILHALQTGNTDIVKMLLNRASMLGIEYEPIGVMDSVEFPAGMTPLIMAGHCNSFELIKLLMDRGHTMAIPHRADCFCMEKCSDKRNGESLTQSRARYNAFKALASPAYICMTSPDPILSAFKLSNEFDEFKKIEKEFAKQYGSLSQTCRDFAVDLLEQTRTTEEVELVMMRKEGTLRKVWDGTSFTRLALAADYEQREFVAHSNIQQVLRKKCMGEWIDWRTQQLPQRIFRVIFRALILPFTALIYLLCPANRLTRYLSVPINKFVHMLGTYIMFLVLIELHNTWDAKDFIRGPPTTGLEWPIILYILGLVWAEIRKGWILGHLYFKAKWNWYMSFMLLCFMTTFATWTWAYIDVTLYDNMYMERKFWYKYDPTLIAESFFAISTILAFGRLMYFFQIHEMLGPLEVSISRMFGDIIEFLVIFLLVMLSFTTGISRLYKFYGDAIFVNDFGVEKPMLPLFSSFPLTFRTLFWGIFGVAPMEAADIVITKYKVVENNVTTWVQPTHPFTEATGNILFCFYHVVMSIALLNLIIAKMTNSYQHVWLNADVEWKFVRVKVWLTYFDQSSCLPPPFNIIPSAHSLQSVAMWIAARCCLADSSAKCSTSKCCYWDREDDDDDATYELFMQALVKRYINRKNDDVKEDVVTNAEVQKLQAEVKDLKEIAKELMRKVGTDQGDAQSSTET